MNTISSLNKLQKLRFSKMHGAGNDFVVLDLRSNDLVLDAELASQLADRHFGVGCDQILTIEAARSAEAVASYRIWNADGSLSGQCGNGARCVAAWLVRDGAAKGPSFIMDSPAGTHAVEQGENTSYAIAMGMPRFEPAAVPMLGFEVVRDEYIIELAGEVVRFGSVSMGNPHVVIEVNNVASAAVERLGAALQRSRFFPESCNVGFAQVLAPDHVSLRVYERGAGETLACGSGACAAAAVLMRRGRIAREATVSLPGGDLQIAWPQENEAEIVLSGPTEFVFEGEWCQ